MVERDEGLCSGYAGYHLDLVVEEFHQMLVVAGKEFDEHGVWTGGEMTLHDLMYLFKLRHYLTIHGPALKIDTDICTGAVTKHFRIDIVA